MSITKIRLVFALNKQNLSQEVKDAILEYTFPRHGNCKNSDELSPSGLRMRVKRNKAKSDFKANHVTNIAKIVTGAQ
jgi:hypothetical protein